MAPANFSVRPRSKRRFIAPIVIGVLLIAAILVYVGSRGSSPTKPFAKKSSAPPSFGLSEAGFVAVFEGSKPADSVVRDQRRAVQSMFTDYYFRTFANPTAWRGDPTFRTQAKLFTPEAQAAFTRDIGALTIGDGRADFVSITPSIATIKTSMYFDKSGKPSWAVSVVVFRATARTKTKHSVIVAHTATYRLQKSATGWLIFSYDANQKQDTPASPSPSPSGTPA